MKRIQQILAFWKN